MGSRKTIFMTCLMWLLVVSSIALCANAATGARPEAFEQGVHPQGCRCCFFIFKPLIHCGRVCCGDDCC
ncbi:hypothetical protein COLO4_33671 [Corchorus olitorius]|uniref:Transmembrane protein n=1 Tax=Corchorus olitorius TaxID=93759 RepID=A0A1R3GS55_9ROSI|nr:hypothetical protein COLO4_33671 [Corchorus olitorius]